MLLFLNGGVFYEFMPLSELSQEFPRTLTLSEVELDQNYALVISTNAGLWRYLIGDTVKFTCLKPFRIVISGRTKSFINACGEELVVENAERAVAAACTLCKAVVKEYTAAPRFFPNKPPLAMNGCLNSSALLRNLSAFVLALDEELKRANSDYAAKRHKDLNLAPPLFLIKARSGLFYDWLKAGKRLGERDERFQRIQ